MISNQYSGSRKPTGNGGDSEGVAACRVKLRCLYLNRKCTLLSKTKVELSTKTWDFRALPLKC